MFSFHIDNVILMSIFDCGKIRYDEFMNGLINGDMNSKNTIQSNLLR